MPRCADLVIDSGERPLPRQSCTLEDPTLDHLIPVGARTEPVVVLDEHGEGRRLRFSPPLAGRHGEPPASHRALGLRLRDHRRLRKMCG